MVTMKSRPRSPRRATTCWRNIGVTVGTSEENAMSRDVGERYECEMCGAAIVYEKGCPCCKPAADHSEICCGKQMAKAGT